MAAQVASVPYDTVSTAEAAALAKGNPHSFLHVVKAEIDCPGVAHNDPSIYRSAREALARLQQDTLQRDATPSLYVYRLTMGAHVQHGLVATCSVADYDDGGIRRHEYTRPDKLEDRINLITALNAHSGPVFLTYADHAPLDALIATTEATPAECDITGPLGVQHALWRVADPTPFVDAFAAVPCAYIADGHHRAAAASAVAASRAAAGHPPADDGAAWFLTVLFPASQMQILPYNRVVTDLGEWTAPRFLEALRRVAQVTPCDTAPAPQSGSVGMFLGNQWYTLLWTDRTVAPRVADQLDVSHLQRRVLAPLLGIEDPRRDQRIDFVGGIRGTDELEQRVQTGEAAVAFVMPAVTVDRMMEIADAGEVMPPKSTWFEPKLLSGMVVHAFQP